MLQSIKHYRAFYLLNFAHTVQWNQKPVYCTSNDYEGAWEGVMHAWGFMVKVHILPGMWWMGQSRTCQLPHPGSSDRARWGGVKRCDPVTLNEGRIEIGFLYDGYWQPCEFLLMCWFARWFCVIKPMKYREWKRERRTKRKRKQRGLQGANNYINFSMTRIACISPVGCVEWPPQPTVDMAWVSISI